MDNQPGEGEDQHRDPESFTKVELEFVDFLARCIAEITIKQVEEARMKRYQDEADKTNLPDQQDA